MKRDLSLIRSILLACEETPAGESLKLDNLSAVCGDRAMLSEHISIMAEADLLQVTDVSDHDGDDYVVHRLTWSGHEFISVFRDDTLWSKVKTHVVKPGVSWTLDLVKEWGKREIKNRLGIP